MNRRFAMSRAGKLARTLSILIIGALFFYSIIVWFNIQRSFPQVDRNCARKVSMAKSKAPTPSTPL